MLGPGAVIDCMFLSTSCVDIDVLDKTYNEFSVPTIIVFTVDNFPSP